MIVIPGTSLPALSNPGAAADLKNGKQLIDANGNVLTGTMPNITLPTPGITVSSGGLITASYEAAAGYSAGGSKSGTKQLTTQAGTTITPGTSQKTAVASGRYTTGPVYVAGDSDLKASNIKDGVNIFGVTGTNQGPDYYFRSFTSSDYDHARIRRTSSTSGGSYEFAMEAPANLNSHRRQVKCLTVCIGPGNYIDPNPVAVCMNVDQSGTWEVYWYMQETIYEASGSDSGSWIYINIPNSLRNALQDANNWNGESNYTGIICGAVYLTTKAPKAP